MKLEEFLSESQVTLTPEQAIHKASKGGKSYTVLSLAVLWKDLNRIHFPEVFQPEPSMKTMGQLKLIVSKLPGIDIGFVLARVIGSWMEFGKYLKGQGIIFDWPDKPHVGFLLKHIGPAVEFSKTVSSPAKKTGMKVYEASD